MSIIIRLSVENQHGVLDQITGIVRRYGWNINEINAGESEPGLSNINMRLKDRRADIKILTNRLSRLECIRSWEVCDATAHSMLELCMLKLDKDDCPSELYERGRIVYTSDSMLILSIMALPWEIDAVLTDLGSKVVDCARSGTLCLQKEEA